jgi:hypothetical protein
MKKILTTTFIVLTLLTIPVSSVFAGSALELIEVRNDSAGPTFVFRVTGEFSKVELNTGSVHVQSGDDYTLHCGQKQEDKVICHTTKKVGGNNVVLVFGNARFWTYVPIARICYSIWDWLIPPDPSAWTDFGPHCQDHADHGDQIQYYNQYSDSYWSVTFYDFYTPLAGTCALVGQPPEGPAYYFPSCP